mmetsp:Transcript_5055/g.14647  ORF Transcript_5055/g.14647 Transcript_5055/m.14647 type:complete len:91 (-) Transcript_5055:12-284(-)
MTRQLLLPIIVGAIAAMSPASGMVLREPPKVATPATVTAEYGKWSPSSWRTKESKQIPEYPDPEALEKVEEQLSKCAPLVFAGEVRNLSD